MKTFNSYKRALLTAVLTASVGTMMAQELNSAYFTQDYKYRHQLNPAFGNDQGYVAIPVLGNFNIKAQGNVGAGDFLFANPNYGKPGEKKTVTFMHPSISYDEAMSGFSSSGLKEVLDLRLTLISVGFKGFGGYNTIEINEKTSFGLSLPRNLLEFAKSVHNDDYSFDQIGVRAQSYAEIAFGHSRDIDEKLRVGGKFKILIGGARANVEAEDMHASMIGDKWVLEGKARGELNAKGATMKNKTEEYKSRYVTNADGSYKLDANGQKIPETYKRVDGIDMDGGGVGGFGLGIDLGGVYKINDDFTVSAAITDLGFISWETTLVAENSGTPFEFDGFHDVAVKGGYAGDNESTFKEKGQDYSDQLADFLNLQDKGDEGGQTSMLAATFNAGVEYTLPVYRKITFGFLGQHHFAGKNYSWTEGRLSANWTPLKWLNGGINLGVNTFSTSMGWVLNIHPKGFNFFLGMDHLLGKTNKDFVPVSDANFNLAMGMNVTF